VIRFITETAHPAAMSLYTASIFRTMPSLGFTGLLAWSIFPLMVAYIVYYRFCHPLASFPGPRLCSISNLWKLWVVATGRMPDELVKFHERFGPIVRIGPNDLSFNSADAISDIYRRGWQKGEFYRGFKQPEPGLFSMTDEKLHTQRKRMFGLGFSMQRVEKSLTYESILRTV
jgi:hypothetical protein